MKIKLWKSVQISQQISMKIFDGFFEGLLNIPDESIYKYEHLASWSV